ncbi:beta-1,3-glucanase family protein, partial [Conexibacter sp. JD483]|uniref:beta-1,3-glucanase family protein n=2 Tax=Conexibacter TaxID=191494 RepID=UPI0028701820
MTAPVRRALLAAALLPLLAVLAPAPAASALQLQLVNDSGVPDDDVYVTVAGDSFDVPGMSDDVPVTLASIPGGTLTVDTLVSGRVYVAYGAPVTTSVPFSSPTRFDWAELTVKPSSSDVANLTAVDQFGIGMQLATLDGAGRTLETLGAANSQTIFSALQQIPGGPQATVRGAGGEIVRVVSPLHSDAYPDLGDYVRSLAGQTVTLHTAFFGSPFTTSAYSGTFAADGSIALSGTSDPAGAAPASFQLAGETLIDAIYTGAGTPNTLQGAITRDLYAGFSTGLWGGVYGNDAIAFCSDAVTTAQGSWCPNGFNQPAFGDARARLSPFATCEKYAAVINAYADVYGNPYSDASKRVTVGLDQPGSGGTVQTLKLTILPDSGDARPVAGGNLACGAAVPANPLPEPPAQPADPITPGPAAGAAPAPAPAARRPGRAT